MSRQNLIIRTPLSIIWRLHAYCSLFIMVENKKKIYQKNKHVLKLLILVVHLLICWIFFDWFPTFTLLPLAGLGLLGLYGGGWFTGITLPVEVLSDDSKLVLLARGQTLNVVEGHSIQKKIIIFY